MSGLESGDPVGRGREQDPVPGVGCFDPEPDREVGLPGPGRAEEHEVLGGVDEGRGAEVRDRVALECGLVVEVEVLERLAAREPSRPDPELGT